MLIYVFQCIHIDIHILIVFQQDSYDFFGVTGWQKDKRVIFVTLNLSGVVLSPAPVAEIWAKVSGDLTWFNFPFLTQHCNMNDMLDSQKNFLWRDRGVINYKNASVISFKSLFPILENRVPSCLFHKSNKYMPLKRP